MPRKRGTERGAAHYPLAAGGGCPPLGLVSDLRDAQPTGDAVDEIRAEASPSRLPRLDDRRFTISELVHQEPADCGVVLIVDVHEVVPDAERVEPLACEPAALARGPGRVHGDLREAHAARFDEALDRAHRRFDRERFRSERHDHEVRRVHDDVEGAGVLKAPGRIDDGEVVVAVEVRQA